MRKTISINLIDNEQAEYRDGCRVVGEPLTPKADDEPDLDDAVAKQIERGEMLAANRYALC